MLDCVTHLCEVIAKKDYRALKVNVCDILDKAIYVTIGKEIAVQMTS